MSSSSVKFTLILLIAVSAWSCASTSESQKQTSRDDANLEAIYWAQIDSARSNYTQADVNFMTGMIVHHAQAIVMSRLAPTHGAGEQVQTLAARIINAQKAEIKAMQRWLRRRDEPVPKVKIKRLGLEVKIPGHSAHMSHKNMAGMLSPKQLEKLDDSYGDEFDRLFLKYMIQHHSGALVMVEKLFNQPKAAQAAMTSHIAAHIQAAQRTEIARMKRMIQDLSTTSN